MGTVIFLVIVIVIAVAGLINSLTEKGQADRAEYLARKDRRVQAAEAARHLSGPGWSLELANRNSVNVGAGGQIAMTFVTIRNESSSRASFKVEVVLADKDNVRIGTISALSAVLDPKEKELLKVSGIIAPMMGRKFGRIDYRVARL